MVATTYTETFNHGRSIDIVVETRLIFICCTGINALQGEEQVSYDPEIELRSEQWGRVFLPDPLTEGNNISIF